MPNRNATTTTNTMKVSELSNFARHYLISTLWSSVDDDGEPLDSNYNIHDFTPESIQKAQDDCDAFQKEAGDLLSLSYESDHYVSMQSHPDCDGKIDSAAGHDFWLTRNSHGTGFWDRGNEPFWKALSAIAERQGSCDVYVGDAGHLHFD